jgi:hypothetical protein
MVLLADGSVVATGGEREGVRLASAERRDPTSGRWTAIAPMRTARAFHRAIALPDGRMLVLSGGDDRCALEVWTPGRDLWEPVACTDPAFVPEQGAVVAGTVVLVGPTVGGRGLRTRVWKPGSRRWSDGAMFPSNPHHFHLQPWGNTALLFHQTGGALWQATLLDAAGRAVQTGPAPGAGSGLPQVVRLASGRVFTLIDGRASLSDDLFSHATPVEPPPGRALVGRLLPLDREEVLMIGVLGDLRRTYVWSDLKASDPCRDLAALVAGARVPTGRSDGGREYLNEWLDSIDKLATPACREAVRRGAAPALLTRLYALVAAEAPEAPFMFERSLGRFTVCALGLPWMTAHMRDWFSDRSFGESRVDLEVRAACLAALADAGQPVSPLLAAALRKDRTWELDAAVAGATRRSPALRPQLEPLLRAAYQKRARNYTLLYSAACTPPDPSLSAVCRRVVPDTEHEERRRDLGAARLLLEGRLDRPQAGRIGLAAGLDLRGFLGGRWAGAFGWHLGGTRRGFSYEADLFPLGVGMSLGGTSAFALLLGVGLSGSTGEVPFGVYVPAEVAFDFGVGSRLRLMSFARAGWLLGTSSRKGGAPDAPFADQVSAGLRLRLGRSFIERRHWAGRGGYLGLGWAEAVHTRTISLFVGYAVDMAGSGF